jgi:hypothetical protein
MATIVFTDAYVMINSVELSDHVKSVTLNYSADDVEDTNMGDTTHIHLGGLLNWSLDVEFASDWASGEIDATLFSLVGAASVTVAVRPVNATIASTNPEYTGSAVLLDYPPISGAVGELKTTSAHFESAGALTRDVTP